MAGRRTTRVLFTSTIAGALCVTGTVGAVGGATTAAAAASAPSTSSVSAGGKPESVIVVLRDQLASTPATTSHIASRRGAARRDQDRVLDRLGGSATHVVHYTLGNAFSATVSGAQAAQLAADPEVASVVPNRKVQVSPPAAPGASDPSAGGGPTARSNIAAAKPPTASPQSCSSDRAKPKLEPEALQTMNARSSDPSAKTAAALGITGAGVKVGFIADAFDPKNQDFVRGNGTSAISDYKDFYGASPDAPVSGAEAFGDASAIAAQGRVVHDVANYSNPKAVGYASGHCYIKIEGVAPGSSVVALDAGGELLPNSSILQAIDYAVSTDHVDVLNESFGANVYPDSGTRNTIQLFDDQATAAGVAVTVSSGDAGISGTVGSPATDPKLISASASTDSRLYEQTDYALATRFGNGKWLDSNTSALSSAGVTQRGRVPDISAPGEADWAVCEAGGHFQGCPSFANPDHKYSNIQAFGGTSQSAPLTAGVAALVIQAYRKTHGGSSPTPAVTKKIITSTTRDLGLPGDEQGSGLIDARAAVEAAFTWPGAKTTAPAGTGQNIALDRDQVRVDAAPGSTAHTHVTVTNVGTKPQTIVASTRKYEPVAIDRQTATLDTTSKQTTPYPTTGLPWVYRKVTFTVPSGVDELRSTIFWNSKAGYNGDGPVVRASLFEPDGTYAANTRPQGVTVSPNYGVMTVKRPAAGTWTAVLYTPVDGGFTGNVHLVNESDRAVPTGTVSPSTATIAPGASRNVAVSAPMPAVGGDSVATLSIGSSGGHQTAVPIVLRALVPTSGGSGKFAGLITGGNARGGAPAQSSSYAFDVPKGKKSLDVAVKLADQPKDLLETFLIDPNDEVQSINSNQTVGKGLTLQNTVASPIPGRWHYVVTVVDPVSGTQLNEPFTGTVSFDPVSVSPLTLPGTLTAGKAVHRTLTVRNTSKAPMVVQTDARAGATKSQQLAPQFAGSTISLPLDPNEISSIPQYLVPPDTKALSVTSSTTSPAQVELTSPGLGIDVFGDLDAAQNGSTVSTATVSEPADTVGLGYWQDYVQQIGPFGPKGAPSATSVLSAAAKTRPLDPAVKTSTGDPYAAAFDPSAPQGTPVVIAPGASKKITVTITPSASKGSTVSGVLHLVTTPLGVAKTFNTTGEVLANLPYSYQVG